MGVRDPSRRFENQRPVIAITFRHTQDSVTGERRYESTGARLRTQRLDALLQITNALAQRIAEQTHAVVGDAQMLALMAADRPQTYPCIPIAGIAYPLKLGTVRALAVEIDGLPTNLLAFGAPVGIVQSIQVAPGDHVGIGIVDRHHPAGETGAAEIAHRLPALVQRAILR